MSKSAPLLYNRLIPLQYVERNRHKGYITRSECVGTVWYDHLSCGMEEDGIRVYYIKSKDQDRFAS